MAIKLSIASAVYNLDEGFLRNHIEGILPQLTDEAELLLIDDCSTNQSGAVCKAYADANENVRYIRMEQNGGLSRVRNRSMEEAQGKWIFFADGDDILSKHFVKTALRFFDSDADIIIHERLKFIDALPGDAPCDVNTLTQLPDGAGEILSISCMCLDTNISRQFGMSNRAFYHAAWGGLYRKAFLTENKLQFPPGQKKAQDAVFNAETYYHAKKIEYLPYVMYFYRGNPEGITRRYSKDLHAILNSLVALLSEQKERFFAGNADVDARFQNNRLMSCVMDNMRLNIFHKDNPKSKEERKAEFLAFVEEEPYKSAIERFDAGAYNRLDWLLAAKLIKNKRFGMLDKLVPDDKVFSKCSGAYKRLAGLFR